MPALMLSRFNPRQGRQSRRKVKRGFKDEDAEEGISRQQDVVARPRWRHDGTKRSGFSDKMSAEAVLVCVCGAGCYC